MKNAIFKVNYELFNRATDFRTLEGYLEIEFNKYERFYKFLSPINPYYENEKEIVIDLNDKRLNNFFEYLENKVEFVNRDEYVNSLVNELLYFDKLEEYLKLLHCSDIEELFNVFNFYLDVYIEFNYLNNLTKRELLEVMNKLTDIDNFLNLTVENAHFDYKNDKENYEAIKLEGYDLLDY